MKISIKYIKMFLDENTCKRIESFIGDKEYTSEQLAQHLRTLPESDAEWIMFKLDEVQNKITKESNYLRKASVFSSLIIATLVLSFVLAVIFRDTGYTNYILLSGIAISLVLKSIKKKIYK